MISVKKSTILKVLPFFSHRFLILFEKKKEIDGERQGNIGK